jgi:thioesterase domain-containing protein
MPGTIEGMASVCLKAVTACQPRGPYILGGYCNGALVAWEMARVLEGRGERVELLVMIAAAADTRFCGLRRLAELLAPALGIDHEQALAAFARFRFFRRDLLAEPSGRRLGFLLAKTAGVLRELLGRRPLPAAADPAFQGTALEVADRLLSGPEAYRRYRLAVMAYVPRPWHGRVVLFWPGQEPLPFPADPTAGWGRLAGSVDVHVIPGSHSDIVARYVHLIADRLRPYLADSGSSGHTTEPLASAS